MLTAERCNFGLNALLGGIRDSDCNIGAFGESERLILKNAGVSDVGDIYGRVSHPRRNWMTNVPRRNDNVRYLPQRVAVLPLKRLSQLSEPIIRRIASWNYAQQIDGKWRLTIEVLWRVIDALYLNCNHLTYAA
jgi:hypothetical protein